MTVLYDRNKKAVAYLYNNVILQADSLLVAGLILGHSVYGVKGMAKGKYFNHKLYNKNGEIVAITSNGLLPEEIDNKVILYQAWQLLGKIKAYDVEWITPVQRWSPQSLHGLLY